MKEITIQTRSIWAFLISLAIITFAYIQAIGYIIPGFEEIRGLTKETITIRSIGLMWVPVISYAFIASFIYIVARIFKEPKHLIKVFLRSFVLGIMVGIILGFILGIIWGLSWGLFGIIIGLIIGLLSGIVVGVTEEFKKNK